MNHAHRHRHGTMISCLAFVALAGCAEYKAENPALTEYPGIQSQIENFYDANATEDDWACDSPQMNRHRQVQVVSQSATQVRMAVTYYFQSSGAAGGAGRQLVPGLQHPLLHLRQGVGRPAQPGDDDRAATGTERMTRLAKTSTRATAFVALALLAACTQGSSQIETASMLPRGHRSWWCRTSPCGRARSSSIPA